MWDFKNYLEGEDYIQNKKTNAIKYKYVDKWINKEELDVDSSNNLLKLKSFKYHTQTNNPTIQILV